MVIGYTAAACEMGRCGIAEKENVRKNILFRIFDIAKPGPVRAAERWLPGGWGVMLDDVVAGFLAMLCLCVLYGFAGDSLL